VVLCFFGKSFGRELRERREPVRKARADWSIPDPKDLPPHEYRTVRDSIESKVKALLEALVPPAVGTITALQNIKLSFHEIEGILQTSLPPSARKYRAWWANDASHIQAATWLSMGWRVAKVDFQDELVIFELEQ